jgi:hypothetical protein
MEAIPKRRCIACVSGQRLQGDRERERERERERPSLATTSADSELPSKNN